MVLVTHILKLGLLKIGLLKIALFSKTKLDMHFHPVALNKCQLCCDIILQTKGKLLYFYMKNHKNNFQNNYWRPKLRGSLYLDVKTPKSNFIRSTSGPKIKTKYPVLPIVSSYALIWKFHFQTLQFKSFLQVVNYLPKWDSQDKGNMSHQRKRFYHCGTLLNEMLQSHQVIF